MKKPLIVIAGATASGKTGAAIELAKLIDGEIISADSMQVYKYMDIGTAKVSHEEMQGIKHYLIDEVYPDEEFSVAEFQRLASKYIDEIYKKGKIPILAGGTGFYINAVIYNNDFKKTVKDVEYRKYLTKIAEEKGNEYLHSRLAEVDYEAWGIIHPNDVKKVIRALEYFRQTGEKISEHNKAEKSKSAFYDVLFFVLNMERQSLYERIEKRVDRMVENGIIEEVRGLLERGYSPSLTSMQGLGYKELVTYLSGEASLEEAIELLKRNTRRFAKRQITWFTHQTKGSIMVDVGEKDDLIKYVKQNGFIF